MRPCLEPACPEWVDAGRCDQHRRTRDKARGTRQSRGYDAKHERIRAAWRPIVESGSANCWRCREPLAADEPWTLGHCDNDRSVYHGPECTTCDYATAGRTSCPHRDHRGISPGA